MTRPLGLVWQIVAASIAVDSLGQSRRSRRERTDGASADEQELVILITPELVHPVDPEVCLSLPGSDLLEPGDLEFYVKGHLESRKTQEFRSPVRTDWARLKRYRQCEDVFIIGPNGHSYGCRDKTSASGHLQSTATDLVPPAWPPAEIIPAPTSIRDDQSR